MTTAAPVRRPARRPPKPDPTLVEAVELARAALTGVVPAAQVGEHLGYEVDGDRVVTHLFAGSVPGYRGWRWAVTLARASRAKTVTVDESVLLPGPDALVAPAWVPWSERVQPGDLGAGDLLPSAPDDPRLVPGWTGGDRPAPDDVRSVVVELGLGRERVLSVFGRDLAAERWYAGEGGPSSEIAQHAPEPCATCGFAVPLRGALGAAFAVCANADSPRDGAVVTFDFGCGAHSAVVAPGGGAALEPVLDTLTHDALVHDALVHDALVHDTVGADLLDPAAPRARRRR